MIDTIVWQEQGIQQAAETLRRGGLVAFPTETVYGLGADARSSEAVAGIFGAKGRPSDNPLIVHIADRSQLGELVEPYPALAGELMERFWPGPLTIVLPAKPGALSPLVTANLPTVGVRMPDHPLALELLSRAGVPVAAPSANRSGRPSPTLAGHVLEDLGGRIDGVIDGGATGVGLESTVVELEGNGAIRILRPGGVTEEALKRAFPAVSVISEAETGEQPAKPRSPGMKYTHYAPRGELTVVQGPEERVISYINLLAEEARHEGMKTGVLAFSEHAGSYRADLVLDLGSENRLDEAAHRLYAHLRKLDEAGVGRIWSEGCEPGGLGGALMNRMLKAAGGRAIRLDR
ncbi:L-threonylcarbamoyladenylate synthase [Paenibacillus soyae]|uniref:Threonylcarbamoyl-AMP synthase n=1 Tax=Paenibacillus soyae TaxID=2969249 RepID=A0A9X2SB89_9BACL|nr:L-threonylcarbamoyladenylate synthase [Paenibacillus soyae]MCR2807439.1 L-threonylcarbamoyladenylate synthase [Paenibacillus soyae]